MQPQGRTGNRTNLIILSSTLVVVMLGFGMVIPIFPFFVVERMGAGGSALGLLVATGSLTELLFGPLWGSISDRVGRKPILMIGMLGYGLSMVLFGLSTELWMLFASRALSGVLSAATLATAMAYIGDSTGDKDRAGGMGALGGAAGLGIILGPGLGGWLAGDSLATPFFIAAAMSVASMILIVLLLPESLPPEARVVHGKIGLVDFRELRGALRSPIAGLLLLVFIGTIGTSNFEAIFSLYALDVLGYGPERVGMILTVVGGVSVIGRGLLTGLATRWWGETAVIKGALLAGAVAFLLLLLAETQVAVLLTTGLFVLITAFFRPAVHSLTSQRATVGQGAAMGLSNAFVSLGRVVGPIWAGAIYDLNTSYPYLSGAVILFIAFLLSLLWMGADKINSSPTIRC
ncbi:MAG TPA: MFS transporter [Chloroflexota bacterium]|nr:MFS transporter [Chloroflexota bacterium]